MDSYLYNEIIQDFLHPFVMQKFYGRINLHQDNDPKHCSRLCAETLQNLEINWVKKL